MSDHLLPSIAAKYACGLADVHSGWLDYLKNHKLEPKALLADGVHLNDHGGYLMAELLKQYLVYRPELASDRWLDNVRTFTVGREVNWHNGKLVLEFEGNRVDLIAGANPDGKAPNATITIDGKKPSAFPALYRVTRPTPAPGAPLALVRVDAERPLQLEDWTVKLTSISPDSKTWKFEVVGSKTGPDGAGSSGELFVSKSGRVKIEPSAWLRKGQVPTGHQIQWKVLPLFADTFTAPKAVDAARESTVTLAQGLSNSRHRLEISVGKGTAPIQAIRVYRPAVK
jgi:hypothetical protein